MSTLTHFDTCLSCYVLDWSGCVIQAAVDGATTNATVMEQLLDEVRAASAPPPGGYRAAERAIREFFKGQDMSAPFDSSIEVMEEGADDIYGDSCYAFFRIEK